MSFKPVNEGKTHNACSDQICKGYRQCDLGYQRVGNILDHITSLLLF